GSLQVSATTPQRRTAVPGPPPLAPLQRRPGYATAPRACRALRDLQACRRVGCTKAGDGRRLWRKRRVKKKNWTLRHHSPAPAPRYNSARAREKRKRRKTPQPMRGDFRPIDNTLLPSNRSRGVPFQTKSTEWAGQRKTCLLRHLVVTQVC